MDTLIIKILFAFFFLFPNQYQLVNRIKIDTGQISTDNFGFLYIYTNNSLKKYSKSGAFISEFGRQLNGNIGLVDVSDPYLLLLFYKDLNQIIFLDDKLSPIGSPIGLDDMGLYNVSTICKSKQFAVWIYDSFENRVVHYGFNPKKILQEINLDLLNIDESIVFMRESGNYLVLNSGNKLIVFDQFGTYIKSLESETSKTFQIQNKQIVWFSNSQFILKSIETDEIDSLPINFVADIENALIDDNQVYIQKKDSVLIYRKAN